MDEIWVRVGLVAAALLLAGLIALGQRRRRNPIRDVFPVSLEPGVYFFSAATCPTCSRARERLDQELGEGAYVEFAWEDYPGIFAELEVDAVPAVVIVSAPGRARLFPGAPDRALGEL